MAFAGQHAKQRPVGRDYGETRPRRSLVGAPDRKVGIVYDGMMNLIARNGLANGGVVLLMFKLRAMNAYYGEGLMLVLALQGLQVR